MVFILNPNDPYVSVHIGTGICSANVTRSRRVLRQRRTIFFRNTTPHFRSLRPLPTTDLEKNKNCHIPDENIPWPRYTTRRIIRRKKKNTLQGISDDSALRSPIVQRQFQTKSACISIVAFVLENMQATRYTCFGRFFILLPSERRRIRPG